VRMPFANTRTDSIEEIEYKKTKFHWTHCVEGVAIANFFVHKLCCVLCGFLLQTHERIASQKPNTKT